LAISCEEVNSTLNKKVLLGIVILAVALSGPAISLIPLALTVQPAQQFTDTQYYSVRLGPRWRLRTYQNAPYGQYGNYGPSACPFAGHPCLGTGVGYPACPYWQEYPQPGYQNYPS